MYAIDFEYDDRYLSEYGFIICNFNESSGANVVDAGSRIKFNTVPQRKGKHYSLTSTQYDECIQTVFDICKNPEIYDQDEMAISNDEYRELTRWLNRHEFLKFKIFFEDDPNRDDCFYYASFNIEKIKVRDILYGLRLTMESNAPFGYGEEQFFSHNFIDISKPFLLSDYSDEIGSIYPDVTITCNEDGDLRIHNELEECLVAINNCKTGEVITMDGRSLIISTSRSDHKICNDFNYEFLRIGNTYETNVNRIYASKLCKLEIRYTPIIKDAP